MILQMPHSFRWGDRAWVVRSKTLAKSVYGRRQRLACYVPMSGGERQIRHFFSAFILMYTVSFIIYMTVWLTPVCVLFDFYWIYIKICGESVPLRPDRTEIIYKSPEGLTKSVRFSGLFFLPRKVYSRGLQRITIQHGKVVNLWLDQFWEIVRNTHEDCRSESELIHYLSTKSKKWIKSDSLPHLAQICPVWGRYSALHTDATPPANPPSGAFVGLWGGVSRTT